MDTIPVKLKDFSSKQLFSDGRTFFYTLPICLSCQLTPITPAISSEEWNNHRLVALTTDHADDNFEVITYYLYMPI